MDAPGSCGVDNKTYTVCSPFDVGVLLSGTYTLDCKNNGAVNITSGVCDCVGNYTGYNCIFHGECDPATGISSCTTTSGSTGQRTCVATGDLETRWSECKESASSPAESSRTPIYIGAGICIVVALVGIIIGAIVGRRRAGYSKI